MRSSTHIDTATLLAGAVAGFLVLGIGGRLLMALLTLTTEESSRFTLVGTLQVVGAGTVWGALGGLVLPLLGPLARRRTGVVLGLVSLVVAFLAIGAAAGFDDVVAPLAFIVATAVLFPALFVGYGMAVGGLVRRSEERRRAGAGVAKR